MSELFADGSLAKTAEEAAALMGCPETLLRDAVTARRIPHRRFGTHRGVVFTREDLEAFLDASLVEPVQPMKSAATVTPMAVAPARKRRTVA